MEEGGAVVASMACGDALSVGPPADGRAEAPRVGRLPGRVVEHCLGTSACRLPLALRQRLQRNTCNVVY